MSAIARVIPRAVEYPKDRKGLDVMVVIICLLMAAGGLYLFYISIFQSLGSQSEPVGLVVVKINSIQRRMGDRVLWDRLFTQSPVFDGDLIRVPENSSAILVFDESEIELNENTLIRVQLKGGRPQIELTSGNLNLNASSGSGNISLVIDGKTIDAAPGTVLSAAAGEEGMVLQVSEGTAVLTTADGESREAQAGTLLSLDAQGAQRLDPAAVIIRPRSNAFYLKNGQEPIEIAFNWNRINLEEDEIINLQISQDRRFSALVYNSAAFDNAGVLLDTGVWHWRLLHEGNVLNSGRLTVTDAVVPALLAPSMNAMFRYSTQPPPLIFQWSEVDGAASYFLQVGTSPDFSNPRLERQVWGTSFTEDSELGQGTWYWRVRPVFTSNYEGAAGHSSTSVFRFEQTGSLLAPVLRIPQADDIINVTPHRSDQVFSWENTNEAMVYTIRISTNQNMQNPVITETVRNNFFVYGRNEQPLNPGLYFWSVFFTDRDGNTSPVSPARSFVAQGEEAAPPAEISTELQLVQVEQEPLVSEEILPPLPEPGNRLPAAGVRFGREQLAAQNNIVFSWEAVPGANAYIFTLLHETPQGRRQLTRTTLVNRTTWTLNNLSTLDRGTIVWQVEAVSRNQNGEIERHGQTGENSFVVDIPVPSPVQLIDTGNLYGY